MPLSLLLLALVTTFVLRDPNQFTGSVNIALTLVLLGGLISAWGGILVGVPSSAPIGQRFSWKGFWVGGILGCIFWVLFFIFALIPGGGDPLQSTFFNSLFWKYTILGGVSTALVGGFHPLLAGSQENSVSTIRLLSKKGFLTGLIVGGGMMLMPLLLLMVPTFSSFLIGIVFSGGLIAVVTIISGVAGIPARYLYWRMMALKQFAWAVFGLLLILLATVLQCIEPLSHILGGK